jgi:6-phosphogluconolactonase
MECRVCWRIAVWLPRAVVISTAIAFATRCEAAPPVSLSPPGDSDAFWIYVGTYTGGDGKIPSEGIYRLDFDAKTGKVGPATLAAKSVNPSFLAIAPGNKFVYAVNEIGEFRGHRSGAVSAFAINEASGQLRSINQQSSGGDGPCHLVVDPSAKNVLVANYGGGSVACLPINASGGLEPATSFIQHEGSGANPDRQSSPHAHSINLDAAGRFAVSADLGLDKLFVYSLDSSHGKLTPHKPPFARVAPGSGPRHFAFHPSGKFGYVISEMANTVTVFAYDAARGTLEQIQVISTLPADFKGKSYTAEVRVHPSGKFLYGSNRGHDSIAVFAIDQETGKLTSHGFESTGGKNPRNFAIDPTGRFLFAENQDSDSIVVFAINATDGALRATGKTIAVGRPVCIKMVPRLATARKSLNRVVD